MRTKTLLLFLVLAFATMAQTYHLKTTTLYMTDNGRTTEERVVVSMELDTDFQRLIINSAETQIIDYDILRSYYDNDGDYVIECSATDTNYTRFKLQIHLSETDNRHLIILHYSNITYGYACTIL